MTTDTIEVPIPGLVVLIGAAGAGKSTLARRLFEPSEILSSDDLRAAISGDPADQRVTRTAFRILHTEVGRRLAAGRLVVVDATNVEPAARRALVDLAHRAGVPAVAIALVPPASQVQARNTGRTERVVPRDVVDRHLARLATLGPDPAAIAARLRAEGFTAAHVLGGDDELRPVRATRSVRATRPPDTGPDPG